MTYIKGTLFPIGVPSKDHRMIDCQTTAGDGLITLRWRGSVDVMPVGHAVNVWHQNGRVMFEGVLRDTASVDPLVDRLKMGPLGLGAELDQMEYEERDGLMVVTKGRLRAVMLDVPPAWPEAIFEIDYDKEEK